MPEKIEILIPGRGHSKSHLCNAYLDFLRDNPHCMISELIFGKTIDVDNVEIPTDAAHAEFLGHDLKSK